MRRILALMVVLSCLVSSRILADQARTTAQVASPPVIYTSTLPVVSPAVAGSQGAAPTASVAVIPVSSSVVAVPVVAPADRNRDQSTVAWSELSGNVQAVDRNNQLLTVRDRDGKDVYVTMNSRVVIYRRGQPISYSDVEPNDQVVLRYGPAYVENP